MLERNERNKIKETQGDIEGGHAGMHEAQGRVTPKYRCGFCNKEEINDKKKGAWGDLEGVMCQMVED